MICLLPFVPSGDVWLLCLRSWIPFLLLITGFLEDFFSHVQETLTIFGLLFYLCKGVTNNFLHVAPSRGPGVCFQAVTVNFLCWHRFCFAGAGVSLDNVLRGGLQTCLLLSSDLSFASTVHVLLCFLPFVFVSFRLGTDFFP